MADVIKCPSCGESNLSDLEFCQFCQTRLQPLTGALKGADAAITPGQLPTKKGTAELEPILPQWLRDARASARKEDQQAAAAFNEKKSLQSQSAPSESDLLAGLHSQGGDNDEDDTPDWLASITGVTSKSTKPQVESSDVRWVELGDKDEFARYDSGGSSDEETPSWLAGLKPSEPQPDEIDEASDWFRDLGSSEAQQPGASTSIENSFSDSSGSDTTNWLRTMDDSRQKPSESAESAPYSGSGFAEPEAAASASNDGIPDWLRSLPKSEEPKQDTTPAWLKDSDSEAATDETPAWLSSEATIHLSFTEGEESPAAKEPASLGDVPDWLKGAVPQSQPSFQTEAEEKSVESAQPADTPDWLNSFQRVPAQADEPVASSEFTPPPFAEDSQPGSNMDSLFTDMPDWLSSESDSLSSSIPTPINNADLIAPSELPSWVQAMRPVDSGSSQLPSASSPSDQTLESRGALAGLQGVLPAVAGFAPTSKPKAYSIRLQASEEQQAHAALLEQILEAETAPVPIASFSALRTSRSLRWFLSLIIFTIVVVPLSLRTQFFSLPVGVPLDFNGAMQAAQSIPEGAPVLVAFDYEPARIGEMEAAAAPLFDMMILLRHPHLTFISTNQTGAILAERFISGPLSGHNYQRGIQYLNLGYLPGGEMGIRAFAQNPSITAPYDMSFASVWDFAPLNGVSSLSQFVAMIIVTDDADAARTWIEQTQSARAGIPLMVVSSAQAAPMIQPYFESQQISGLVSGLYGAALFEQYNGGQQAVARTYWDAYSLGMLFAMALVLGGGLWNLALGLRDRAAAREAQ